MIEKTRRYLTVSDGPGKATIGRWADIDDQGYVDGETPIEDYPFYLLTDFPVSEEFAWKVWIEEPEDATPGAVAGVLRMIPNQPEAKPEGHGPQYSVDCAWKVWIGEPEDL